MQLESRRTVTPEIMVSVLKMFPLDTQIHFIFGNQNFLGNVTMLPEDDGTPEMVILKTEETKKRALEFRYNHLIESSKNLSQAFWNIHKPDRLQFLSLLSRIYTFNGEYETILKDAWVMTEFPHQLKNRQLTDLFNKADPDKLMEPEEKKRLAKMPKEIRVYRGYNTEKVRRGLTREKGLSWTTDKKWAEWFARRFNTGDAYVLTGSVKKEKVYMYTDQRGEHEVVVNPRHVRIKKKEVLYGKS